MKKLKYIAVLFFVSGLSAIAQLIPNNTKPYLITNTPRISTSNEADLEDYQKAVSNIQYLDGSARSLQTVGYKNSPLGNDLLMGISTLDEIGRVKKSYLPVASTAQNGQFQYNVISSIERFYNDTAPYSEVENYENSPLSRAFKTVGAGASFRTGTSKGQVQSVYTAGAGIRKYIVNEDVNGNVTSVSGTATFSNGQLLKTTVSDEDGRTAISYTDKEGRLIEKHLIDANSSDKLVTAYVYDDVGRLRYILPPKAYHNASTFNETTGNYFSDGVFAFRYDDRGRVVAKHVPSSGWTYTVFNQLNQAVLSQNSRQRETNLWIWVKKDGHGRTVMSGTKTISATHQQLQDYFKNFTTDEQFEERVSSGGLYEYTNKSFPSSVSVSASDVMQVFYYDNYNWVNDSALDFEEYKTSQWTNAKGLATGSLVRNLGDNALLKSVVYYDNKNRTIQSKSQNRFGGVNQTDYVLNFAGEVEQERVLYRKPSETDLMLTKRFAYDHVGRLLQTSLQVNKGSIEPIAGYEYDEVGRMIQKNLNHAGIENITRNSAISDQEVDLARRFILLNAGTYTSQDGVYLAQVSPDALQKIDYEYNIRGQIRSINGGVLNSSEGDVFAMKLDYFETGQIYNGNVHKQTWQSKSENQNRGFTYTYDGYDRLNGANYSGQSSEDYSLSNLTFDKNGNIQTLQRKGYNGNGWATIDNLVYTYTSILSNQTLGILDSGTSDGHTDDGSGSDFTYYPDGSLKTDANKGITNVVYNFLGLPDEVLFGSTKKIKNVYAADGQKLSQLLIDGTDTLSTDYMGELLYTNDTLKTILHNEGRILVKSDTSIYSWSDTLGNPHADTTFFLASRFQYFIKDHLGNTRIIMERLNDTLALVQETHYYPFGGVLEGIGKEGDWQYLYQGKELIKGWGYDFHARSYDSYLGRFMGIDPVNNYSLSGYAGMMNNPQSYIDPDGRSPILLAMGIGAAIGAFTNGVSSDLKGNGFLNGAWRGGLTGALGGALGSFAPIGILPGMAYGAGSGAATGALGASLNGGNIGRGAMFGAIGGGIFGGASGGIEANRLGANIWTGSRPSHAMYATAGNTIAGETPIDYGAKSVQELYSDNFSDVGMKGTFFTNKGKSVFPEENGSLLFEGKKALAVTESSIWKGGDNHKMYFGKNAFSSKEQLAFTLTHELGHVVHSRLGLASLAAGKATSGLLDNEGHVAIQTMTFNFIKKNGWNYNNFPQAVGIDFIGTSPYPSLLNPIKYLIRKIK